VAQPFSLKDSLRPYEGLPAGEALGRLIEMRPGTVLDVGSGTGKHAQRMRDAGIDVTTISLVPPCDWQGDFMEYDGPAVDVIWASHVLEHVPNPGQFLAKCRELCKTLVITVPPLKTPLVGGHINLFTMGTLQYHLILAGFQPMRWGSYGYNLSVIADASFRPLPDLVMDRGDIEALKDWFPAGTKQRTDESFPDYRW
jgi:SAM-dependent methyltransferase